MRGGNFEAPSCELPPKGAGWKLLSHGLISWFRGPRQVLRGEHGQR